MPRLALLALLLPALAPAVTADARVGYVLGEQPAITGRLFGVTAFEGLTAAVGDYDYRTRLAALRPGCVRVAANVAWYSDASGDPASLAAPAAEAAFSQTLLFGNKYPTGRFLPLIRWLGAEPMASLGGVPTGAKQAGTEHPGDFARWADLCLGMVDLFKRHDPALRYVQIWNEPNASFFRDPRAKERGDAQLHIDQALAVAKRLKGKYPDLVVAGPVLCWPPSWPPDQKGQQPWYTWDKWTVPWLAQTKGLVDAFDFHVYDVGADDLAVQLELVENQAQLAQGRRLPIWITESNFSLADNELNDPVAIGRKRFLPYERMLLRGLLPQADKLDVNLYHDLHAKHYTLLPRTADDPDPMYWLFWVLRDLRGQRVVTGGDDPATPTFATIEEDRVTVVVFNDSPAARDVPLDVSLPGGYWTGPEVRAVGLDAAGAPGRLKVEPKLARQGMRAVGTVPLPAGATASISFRTTGFYPPARRRKVVETFGDATRQYLKAGQPVTVNLPRPTGSAPRLRVGLLGATGHEKLTATWNGQPLALAPTAWQEVPLPAVADQNRLVVTLAAAVDNPRLAVAFAAVVGESEG